MCPKPRFLNYSNIQKKLDKSMRSLILIMISYIKDDDEDEDDDDRDSLISLIIISSLILYRFLIKNPLKD